MARSLWLFNTLLALLCAWLLWSLVDTILDHRSLGFAHPPALSVNRASVPGAEAEDPTIPLQRPHQPLSDFEAILKQDPFQRPSGQAPQNLTPQKALPPVPLPTLLGTIIVGEERKAILKDGTREDIYTIGQSVGGGIIARIETDRVLIKRGEGLAEVLMKSAIQVIGPAAAPASETAMGARPATNFAAPPRDLTEARREELAEIIQSRQERLRRLRDRMRRPVRQ